MSSLHCIGNNAAHIVQIVCERWVAIFEVMGSVSSVLSPKWNAVKPLRLFNPSTLSRCFYVYFYFKASWSPLALTLVEIGLQQYLDCRKRERERESEGE